MKLKGVQFSLTTLFQRLRVWFVLEDVSACNVDQVQTDVNQLTGDVLLRKKRTSKSRF